MQWSCLHVFPPTSQLHPAGRSPNIRGKITRKWRTRQGNKENATEEQQKSTQHNINKQQHAMMQQLVNQHYRNNKSDKMYSVNSKQQDTTTKANGGKKPWKKVCSISPTNSSGEEIRKMFVSPGAWWTKRPSAWLTYSGNLQMSQLESWSRDGTRQRLSHLARLSKMFIS